MPVYTASQLQDTISGPHNNDDGIAGQGERPLILLSTAFGSFSADIPPFPSLTLTLFCVW